MIDEQLDGGRSRPWEVTGGDGFCSAAEARWWAARLRILTTVFEGPTVQPTPRPIRPGDPGHADRASGADDVGEPAPDPTVAAREVLVGIEALRLAATLAERQQHNRPATPAVTWTGACVRISPGIGLRLLAETAEMLARAVLDPADAVATWGAENSARLAAHGWATELLRAAAEWQPAP